MIKQFDIFLVNFNPARGTMPGKIRPAVILQSDILNKVHHPSTIVVPLSSKSYENKATLLRIKIDPSELNGLKKTSFIVIDQLTAVDNVKIIERIGTLNETIQQQIHTSLSAVLNLS
ncbi:MAG: type II toxin-antitoxin system PemK/MazF family toxin [Pyrinomonadaceae bacterium]|nr:type II toxin-antitoxin system PemK/MazF family toxin [Sphingobacteriaceae bacterium]